MTVAEMIDRIIAAFPGATAEAMRTYKPVFYARFQKREGDALQAAFEATLGEFRATTRQPFPIPADFEKHMPSGRIDMPDVGRPIRDELERRINRRRRLITEWLEGQGAKIRATRAKPLFSACLLEAMDQAKIRALDERVDRLVLSADQIRICFQRAIAAERRHRFGPVERGTPQMWWEHVHAIAAEWGLDITPEWWSKSTAEALTQKEAA